MSKSPLNASALRSAIDIGGPITTASAAEMRSAFMDKYPDLAQTIVMPSGVLRQVFTEEPEACGIYFTFGLLDPDDYASVVLILVPGKSAAEKPFLAHAQKRGYYYDNCGSRVELGDVAELSANFVAYQQAITPELSQEQAHRASFLGRHTLTEVIAPDNCSHVLLHFGLKQGMVQIILDAAGEDQRSLHLQMFDYSNPIPPGGWFDWWPW